MNDDHPQPDNREEQLKDVSRPPAAEDQCPVQPETEHEDRCQGVKPDGVDTARDVVRDVKRQEESGDQCRTCQQDAWFHPKSPCRPNGLRDDALLAHTLHCRRLAAYLIMRPPLPELPC